jgi:gliding motility-associated-like protein
MGNSILLKKIIVDSLTMVSACNSKFKVNFSRRILIAIFALFSPINTFAQLPTLGVAQNFGLFSSNGAVTNAGTSNIDGNVGADIGSVTGFGAPTVVSGTIEYANAMTAQCAIDVQSAYNQLFATPQTVFGHPPAFGAGETVFAGVYAEPGAGSLAGNLTLDGQGDPNAIFIFKFGGAFNTGALSNVIMTNGTRSCNVFWISAGAVAMAASTNFKGTIISGPGAVSMAAGGVLEGRMLSTNGAIATSDILITAPCITSDTTLQPIDVECYSDMPAPNNIIFTGVYTCTFNPPTVVFISDVSNGFTCPDTITRTYSVTDDCGTQTLVTQIITVNDITNPTASNPAAINVECIGDVPASDITVVTDEADNCTAAPIVAFVSDVSDGLTCPETITRTYSISDDCSNQILVTQTITINDITNPTASNPATTNVPGGPAPVSDPLVVIDEADNCSVPIVAFVSESTDGADCPETITRIYSVTDACGNTINVTHTILITDPFPPTASNPAVVNEECIGDVPLPNSLVVTDESDNQGVPVVAFVSDLSNGATCPEIIIRTYSVTDICGTELLVMQTITINDITNPTASNLAAINVECIGDLPAPDVTLVNDETDNCTAVPVVAFVSDASDGLTCPETVTRTYSITDDCGNQTLVTQTMVVNDITNPTASNLPSLNVECVNDILAPDITLVNDEADNCSAAPIVAFLSDVSDGNSCPEVITRIYTVTDDCGNQILISQTITVLDTTSPTASNPSGISIVNILLVPADPSVVIDELDNCTVDPTVAWVSDVSDGNICNNEIITRTYSVTDDCGNQTLVIQLITITAIYPTIDAGVDQTGCQDQLITLNAVFSPPTTIISWPASIVNGVPFISPNASTSYIVSGDNNGCISTDELNITVNPNMDISFTTDVNMGCELLDVTFTNTTVSAAPFTSCIWNLGTGATITDCAPISYTYNDAGLYDVSLTVTDIDGCSSTIIAINYINIEPYPIANFSASEYIFNNLVISSEINFYNLSTGATSYEWYFGDGTTSAEQNPNHLYETLDKNSFEITLFAYSDLGCADSTLQIIKAKEELIYYIPNSFTPGSNSINNHFQPVFTSGYDPNHYSLYIYNRWGELLFLSHNSEIGWDGTYNGDYVQDGTYIWKIEFRSSTSAKKYADFGHVNMIR